MAVIPALGGRIEVKEIESRALAGNPLGDPAQRDLWIYIPRGYDDRPHERFPTLYLLAGFGARLDNWITRQPLRPSSLEVIDSVLSPAGVRSGSGNGNESAASAVVVFVDCSTSFGGSQYLDSPGTGRYHTFLCEEVVPFVDAHYRTLAAGEHRGLIGKSSGGYGAMVTPMLRPDLFGALATHSGDALFENYIPGFRECVRTLRDDYGGSYDAFWRELRTRPAMSRRGDWRLVSRWAMAACYSAEADGTVRLPFALDTGELIPEIWDRWLRWDPVRMVPDHAQAMRSLRAIYIDAGIRDEHYLDLGAEAFRQALNKAGVSDPSFELFDDGHPATEYRYPNSVRYLVDRLGE